MIEVGNIVTLDNGQEYLLLEQTTRDDKKYVYSTRVLEDETPTDESLIFEAVVKEDGEFLKAIEDKALYDDLLEEFKDILVDKVMNEDFEETTEEAA